MVIVEIAENTVTRLRIVGTSSSTILKAKVEGTGKSKSNVTEISECDTSKQVEETWSSNTSSHPFNLSQVNAIGEVGRADDGLSIFAGEDSQKRRYSVNWKVGTHDRGAEICEQDEEHELMIDSGCYGHVCPPWFAPQFPLVSSSNVEAVSANNEALRHYGQKVVDGHVTTSSGRRLLTRDHLLM